MSIMVFKFSLLLVGVGAVYSQFIAPPADLITATGYAGYQVRCESSPAFGVCLTA